MPTHRLQQQDWQTYFDRVSRHLGGEQAEIETAGLKLGSPINQEWVLLHGLTYDPKSDILEVQAGDLDHLIAHPREVYVDEAGTELRSVAVIDADGSRQIVRLRQPIALPSA